MDFTMVFSKAQLPHEAPWLRVHPRGRLVQEDAAGIAHQRQAQGQLAAGAAREAEGLLVLDAEGPWNYGISLLEAWKTEI